MQAYDGSIVVETELLDRFAADPPDVPVLDDTLMLLWLLVNSGQFYVSFMMLYWLYAPHACTHNTHMHTVHICICPMRACMHGMMQMYDACGVHVGTRMHADTQAHAHRPYMHMYSCTHVCMWAHVVRVGTRMCMQARTHACTARGEGACWGDASCVVDRWIMHACVPRLHVHAHGGTRRTRAHGVCLLPRSCSRGRVPAPTLTCTGEAPAGRVPHGLWIMHALHHTYTHTHAHNIRMCMVHGMLTHAHSCCMLITCTHTYMDVWTCLVACSSYTHTYMYTCIHV